MGRKNRGFKILLFILLILVLIVVLINFVAKKSIGTFYDVATCEVQRDTYLESGYVCTECDEDYSNIPGYISAWCFRSGTDGYSCLNGGGWCEDENCNICQGSILCNEERDIVSQSEGMIVWEIKNWNNECRGENIVYEVECIGDWFLEGKQFSSTLSGLGSCSLYSNNEPDSICVDDNTLCTNPFWSNGYWYCDLEDYVLCEGGCDRSTNQCIGNEEPLIEEDTTENEERVDCEPGFIDICQEVDDCGSERVTQGNICGDNMFCWDGKCETAETICGQENSNGCYGTIYLSGITYDPDENKCYPLQVIENDERCGALPPTDTGQESKEKTAKDIPKPGFGFEPGKEYTIFDELFDWTKNNVLLTVLIFILVIVFALFIFKNNQSIMIMGRKK